MPQEPRISAHKPTLRDRITDLRNSRDAREFFKWLIKPTTQVPKEIANRIADRIDNPKGEGGYTRGFAAGSVQGVGDLVTEATSPAGIASLLPGMFGAARAGINRAINVAPDPRVPISADPYALTEGPMGRRQFLYQASGAPKKVAEARVAQTPKLVEDVAEKLAVIPKGAMSDRARQLDRIREEADLVEKIQEKHGILNRTVTPQPYAPYSLKRSGRVPKGPDPEVIRSRNLASDTSEAGRAVENLINNISGSTTRKLENQLSILSRTTPIQTNTPVVPPAVKNRLTSMAKHAAKVSQEKSKKTDRIRDLLTKMENNFINRNWGDNPFNQVHARNMAYTELLKGGARSRYGQLIVAKDKLNKEHLEQMAAHWRKYDDIRDKSTSITTTRAKDADVETVLKDALEIYDRTLAQAHRFDQSPMGRSRKDWWKTGRPPAVKARLDKDLERLASQIGGPGAQIYRAIIDAKIAGRQVIDDMRDSATNATLQSVYSRLGIRPQTAQAIEDVATTGTKAVEDVTNLPERATKSLARELAKRFGIKLSSGGGR